MTNHTSMIYAENETKLSWSIELGAIYDKNKIGQWHDQLNRSGLRRKRNWLVMTNRIECQLWWKPDKTTMWRIVWMWSMPKMKLSCCDRSNWVRFVPKIIEDNDATYHSDAVYVEKKITLLWLMGLCTVYDKNQIRKWHDWSYKCKYT